MQGALSRDFLTLARGHPEQDAWALTWVAHIGTLYALNNQRLAATEDSVAFGKREITLHAHLQRMVDDRDVEPQDPLVHPAVVKVLTSPRNHWPGLVVFVDHPEFPLDRVNNWCGKRTLRGVAVVWQSRCLIPHHASRFQSLLVEPDMQSYRIRFFVVPIRSRSGIAMDDLGPG